MAYKINVAEHADELLDNLMHYLIYSLFTKVCLMHTNSFLFASPHFYSFSIHFYFELSCNLLDWNFEKGYLTWEVR